MGCWTVVPSGLQYKQQDFVHLTTSQWLTCIIFIKSTTWKKQYLESWEYPNGGIEFPSRIFYWTLELNCGLHLSDSSCQSISQNLGSQKLKSSAHPIIDQFHGGRGGVSRKERGGGEENIHKSRGSTRRNGRGICKIKWSRVILKRGNHGNKLRRT